MKKLITLIFFLTFSVAYAHGEEAIISFNSSLRVNTDNSIEVVENIVYDSGGIERHGIYRDIYPYSSENRKMSIENVAVADQNGKPYQFQIQNSGKNVRIKIGDPNQTFVGEKTYIIKYRASYAVAQLKDLDEIYWNVTGNEWNIPIYQAKAQVTLPEGAEIIQSACYYGPKGSTERCDSNNFETTNLNPEEGLTVAVGFPKGIVTPYSAKDNVNNLFSKYLPWLLAIILPLLTLFFSLRHWYKYGRDPKGTGVIIAQYDVPDGLTPMEVNGILQEKVVAKDISAEIIYLATLGYIKITQLEEKILGIFKSTDYELTKLKDFSDLPNEHDRKLLESLFEDDQVKLSDLKNKFYKNIPDITVSAAETLLSKGYYKNLGRMKSKTAWPIVILPLFFWVFFIFWGISGTFSPNVYFGIIIGSFSSLIIYGVISVFFPAKTEKGVATKEYILGLKDYLQIAEKDRLKFHNAPEKRPEVFEKLLPFALVLGVEKSWAKEFQDIYTMPPSWYSGTPGSAFNSIYLANSLSNFGMATTSSLSSSPGGSGGGGSSGGGGGGGGGGGW